MTLDPVLTLGTDKHIDIFVQGIITVPYYSFPNMKRLEIRFDIRGSTTGNVDEKLPRYIKKFTRLESLDVHGFRLNITERGIERMLSSAENLKHLGIHGAPWVTKMSVEVERLRIKYPDLDLKINNYSPKRTL